MLTEASEHMRLFAGRCITCYVYARWVTLFCTTGLNHGRGARRANLPYSKDSHDVKILYNSKTKTAVVSVKSLFIDCDH